MPMDETTPLIVNSTRPNNEDILETCQHWTTRIVKGFFSLATLAALALSITAIILAVKQEKMLKANKDELDSVRDEVKTCYNDSYEKIQELSQTISNINDSLYIFLADTTLKLQSELESAESDFKAEEIKMENEVSGMNTNVIKLETNLGV
ncbi:uncharacterized protein LOC124441696 [Xenia sp. Carnegie-2017]|uniref:uncharacterized protein LOC124441696 n=1 Tax=Xenia sp. Carnegie-2017 TaxID=2897299 RepID=UPI001F035124|nr:uncharacterized protein LOC124441696 [Xenia sp. Carnegie-2017]